MAVGFGLDGVFQAVVFARPGAPRSAARPRCSRRCRPASRGASARLRQTTGESGTSAASAVSRSAAVCQSPTAAGCMASSKRSLPRRVFRARHQRRIVAQQQRNVGRLAQRGEQFRRPIVLVGDVALQLQQAAGGQRKARVQQAPATRPIA